MQFWHISRSSNKKTVEVQTGIRPVQPLTTSGVMRKDIEVIEEIPQISDSTYSDSKVSTRNISIFQIFPIGFFRLFQL